MGDITTEEYKKAKELVETFEEKQASDREAYLILENKKLVGTYYKVENSSGGDETWWLYKKVVGADGTKIILEAYQQTKPRYGYPRIEIEKEAWDCLYNPFNDMISKDGKGPGYISITELEFVNAITPMLAELGLMRDPQK